MSLLTKLKEKLLARSKRPWACFETAGPDKDGRVQFSIACNKAFIKNLRGVGYEGMTDEEIVQFFFISARMLPEEMLQDENIVSPTATPRLTSEANILRR